MRRKTLRFAWLFLIAAGCARSSYLTKRLPDYPLTTPVNVAGLYHRVEKGETLSQIARACGTTMSEIAKANRLEDPSLIEPDQLLYIPRLKTKEARH